MSDAVRIAELIRKSTPNHEYFFDNLEDPAWLPVLVDQGFFRKPIEPERGDDWIRFPNWSESRYLVRIAEQDPASVAEIALRLPETENVRVHEDLLRIAAKVPGGRAAALARREAKWLRDYEGHLMSLPDAAGGAIAHLASEGELDAAYELARAILAIVPDEEASGRRRAAAWVNDFHYGRIVEEAWPALAAVDSGRAFRFLCDRLADLVRIGFSDEGHDLTSAWRSAVEASEQNLDHTTLDLLVDLVRDRALELASTPTGLDMVLGALGEHANSSALFERIALFVVRERASADLVAEKLRDPAYAYATDTWHEYGELLRSRYADLDARSRSEIAQLLATGDLRPGRPRGPGMGRDEADLARIDRYTRLKRLDLIADHLEGDAHRLVRELQGEFGRPDHPTFLSYTTSWTGPTSPFSADELRAMGPAELANTLREWRPTGGDEDPSPEGLGRVLADVVTSDAPAFAAEAARFTGLEPTYVRALLQGFGKALGNGTAILWPPVLDLADWLVAQPRSAADGGDDRLRDPSWGWARKQLADLLSRGFGRGDTTIPITERERVWDLLVVLAEDPDPTIEYESGDREGRMDPAMLSINTTRGEAMHAVVRYALWVETALGATGDFAGPESWPEVVALLDGHLDISRDPSPTIRSVYGQWFPQFVRIDAGWAGRLAPLVFPADPSLSGLFAASWSAYVVFNRAYIDVFAVLGDAYSLAIDRLADHSDPDAFAGDPSKRLGDHLFSLTIQGVLEDSDLLERFWASAPSAVRKEVLQSVGFSLEGVDELDPEIRERIMGAWSWVSANSEPHELAPFGSWMASAALDRSWLLEQADEVLRRGVALEPDFVVLAALTRLAPEHPKLVAGVLDRFVGAEAEPWALLGSIEELKGVLQALLGSEDGEVRAQAAAVVDRLGARGITEIRDLSSPERG